MPGPRDFEGSDLVAKRPGRIPLGRNADGTADARPAQPAVPVRHLVEVLLVVVLREVERPRGHDLGGDVAVATRPQPRCGLMSSC